MIARVALLTVVAIGAARISQAGELSLVTVGSKVSTDSVILGELAAQLLESEGLKVRRRSQLGGTQLLWSALLSGEIDLYPEYTGTLMTEILRSKVGPGADPGELQRVLLSYGVGMSEPLGFNNTYALGITTSRARQLGIAAISDLRGHPELKFGFSNEFMDRLDGWHGLRRHYSLPQADVVGLDHDLAYRGLMSGAIDVIDVYTTDADIQYYQLTVLQDDRGYFPDYRAVLLYRADAAARVPAMPRAVKRLEGAIAQEAMIAMNARAKLDRMPETQIAAEFLQKWLGLHRKPPTETRAMRLWKHTVEHISLVAVSLAAAICVAIPLGVISAHRPLVGQVILGIAGVLQTIPSLALLVFMIPVLGIGAPPAIVALFLYSILPIIRNTYTGLRDIPRALIESADALGLTRAQQLRLIELPLASPAILAGVKISAVINVGTATLGALIGAGGYGQPILTGIRLDDMDLILQGAVPAAVMALLVQGLFELAERRLIPKGLRQG
jgi:osmoprotectant transport system permease protein